MLPDTFEGYSNSLQLGPDEDEERLIVRGKEDKEGEGEGDAAKGGGKGKGKRGKVDVEALKAEAKMNRELV